MGRSVAQALLSLTPEIPGPNIQFVGVNQHEKLDTRFFALLQRLSDSMSTLQNSIKSCIKLFSSPPAPFPSSRPDQVQILDWFRGGNPQNVQVVKIFVPRWRRTRRRALPMGRSNRFSSGARAVLAPRGLRAGLSQLAGPLPGEAT